MPVQLGANSMEAMKVRASICLKCPHHVTKIHSAGEEHSGMLTCNIMLEGWIKNLQLLPNHVILVKKHDTMWVARCKRFEAPESCPYTLEHVIS